MVLARAAAPPRGPGHAAAVRGSRSWSSLLRRPGAGGLLLLCACGTFFLAWRSSVNKAQDGFATSLSGHSYHPKLCSGSSDATSSISSSSGGCSELHDPQLAGEVVRLPPGGLQLLSGQPQAAALLQLLQAAVKQQWPLPLARRVTSVLLQGAVPAVQSSSSSGSGGGQQHQQAAGASPPLSASESGHAAGWRFATEALAVLQKQSGGQLVPCSFDPSLPTDFHTRFLFAATWPAVAATAPNSNSTALANAVLQLLNAVALLPPGYAYISVSAAPAAAAAATAATDSSLLWLDLLQLLAVPLGVPVQVVQVKAATTAPAAAAATAAAGLPGQPQPVLGTTPAASQALSAALAGFFPAWSAAPAAAAAATASDTAAAGPAHAQATGGQQESARADAGRKLHTQRQLGGDADTPASDSSSSSSSSSSGGPGGSVSHGSCPPGAPAPGCYAPEFVVLLEPQLYFCAGDLVRVMEYPQDLVCGLQLDEHTPPQLRHRHRRRLLHSSRALQQQQQQGAGAEDAGPSAAAAAGGQPVQEGPMASAVAAAGQAVLSPEVPPEFEMTSLRAAYDAAREISGEMLSAHAPYFSHGPSAALVRSGLPVPMYCCWGGLAKLAAPPLAAGLRFRGGEEGECHPPDPLSLLCDDLWRTGHQQIILDPGVRTSSQLRTKSLFEHSRFPFFYYTQNWETTAWFDIHPMLPLQYWNKTAAAGSSSSPSSSSSSSSGSSNSSGSSVDEGDAASGDVGDDVSSQAAAEWMAADWVPGEQQMCCEGQQWAGAAGPNHPTDCRRVKALAGGKNYTQVFLQRCAAGLHHRQGSGLGAECG